LNEKRLRKRKYVGRLAFALLMQKQKLEETTISALKARGCRDIFLVDHDPLNHLRNDQVQEQILEYLGPKNNTAFDGALDRKDSRKHDWTCSSFKGWSYNTQ
jgi:hypothetical protein